MQTLIALLVAAAAACAIARPPGPTATTASLQSQREPIRMQAPPVPTTRKYLSDYLLPRFLLPQYMGYNDRMRAMSNEEDWLNKEIYRINQLEEEEEALNYELDLQDTYSDIGNMIQVQAQYTAETDKLKKPDVSTQELNLTETEKALEEIKREEEEIDISAEKIFGLTPLDKRYYDPVDYMPLDIPNSVMAAHEGGVEKMAMMFEPRQTRQNPNLSKQKNLLGPDMAKLKTGLSHEINDMTDRPRHIHMQEASSSDPADSIYDVAMVAAIGAALTMAVFGFAFGWYTLSKKAKAAADVDYPAYGVTGPTIDTSGDRKLAHSAHMYHYQHQKQQIIAMERNGLEQRTGSLTDPESEEENEEGDYTVYECPGFATTGDMEVKNPMFSEDPTPATPGKCELVKPQPKN